ncbi:cohesin domain-containing protein [Eubacterium callanderi]|uniref:FIVAR domain-containing protein n=1 Tax=Eubacterium callanderi TaxID=53442 RepID=A0A853JMU1_9FIRM|nr:FIVAR domain-containing protein [Eubacterium callanderi]
MILKKKLEQVAILLLACLMIISTIVPVKIFAANERVDQDEILVLDASVEANGTVAPGEEITLTVRTGEKTKLASCDLYIYYDKDQLTYVSGSGKTLTTSGMASLNTDKAGEALLSYMAGINPANPGGLFTITLKVNDNVTGTLNIRVEKDTYGVFTGDTSKGEYDMEEVTPVITNNAENIVSKLPPTDISELTGKIAEAEAIDRSLYTAASYENLETAIAEAKKITTENTKEEAAAQVKALDDAMKQLVKAVDKTALKAVVAEAKTYDEALYTPDSYAALTKALADAQSMLDADLADNAENQKTAADAVQAVKDAIVGLNAKGDQKALAVSIQAAEAALAREDVTYMDETKANVNTALSAAKALAGQENATDAEVSAAVKSLNDAVAKLVIAADENAFNATVAQVRESFKEEVYTTSSWKAVAEALKNADAVAERLAEGQVPAAEADKVLTDLQNATKGLLPKAEKTEDLTKAIEAVQKLDESHYTAESYAVVKEALAAAEKVAGNLNDSTQQQVDIAAANLNAAASKLVTVAADEKTGVVVNGLEPGEGIRVDDKSKDKEALASVDEAMKNASEFANAKETKILFLADITPEVTENADGSFTVTIPLKADQLKYDAYFVGHKGADGIFTWQAVTPDADGRITFTTKSFSEFTVVGMNRQEEIPSTDGNQTSNSGNAGSGSNTSGGTINPVTGVPYTEEEMGNGALQAAGMLALMGLCGIAFYRRQRKTER